MKGSMQADVIEHLRRNQELERLPGGREAVRVLVQFAGAVPATTRGERKQWLEEHFAGLASELGRFGVKIESQQISGSAQTVPALVPVDQYAQAEAQLSLSGHRAVIERRVQVV
jgi:hypothetical protein